MTEDQIKHEKALVLKRKEFYKNKKVEVLAQLKLFLEGVMGIYNYDYIIEINEETGWSMRETLVIEGIKIGCLGNSNSAIMNEAIGYVILNYWMKDRNFQNKQLEKEIRRYWVKETKRK